MLVNQQTGIGLVLCSFDSERSSLRLAAGRGAPLRDGGDVNGVGWVVQYEHLLHSECCSFVKLPADLNGALLLERREAGAAHLRGRVPVEESSEKGDFTSRKAARPGGQSEN